MIQHEGFLVAHLILLVLQGVMQKSNRGFDADSVRWAREVSQIKRIFMSHEDLKELLRADDRLKNEYAGAKVTQRCPVLISKTLMWRHGLSPPHVTCRLRATKTNKPLIFAIFLLPFCCNAAGGGM